MPSERIGGPSRELRAVDPPERPRSEGGNDENDGHRQHRDRTTGPQDAASPVLPCPHREPTTQVRAATHPPWRTPASVYRAQARAREASTHPVDTIMAMGPDRGRPPPAYAYLFLSRARARTRGRVPTGYPPSADVHGGGLVGCGPRQGHGLSDGACGTLGRLPGPRKPQSRVNGTPRASRRLVSRWLTYRAGRRS